MSVRDTGRVKVTETDSSTIEKMGDERDAYSQGTPVSPDSYEEGGQAKEVSRGTVGFKQILPVLNDKEGGEIDDDLAELARGIHLYNDLPPEERKDMSAKQFALIYAVMESFRHGKNLGS